MNASIYIYRRKVLVNSKVNSRTVIDALEHGSKDKAILYEMPISKSIDIDSEYDFRLVEFLLKNQKSTSKI